MSIEVTGFAEVEVNIKKVMAHLSEDVIEGVLMQGANILAQATINNAPQGPTGNLKRGIIAKVLERRYFNQPGTVIVAPNYRIAPHAQLVEFGHIQSTKRGFIFVQPHPFMRPAWDAYGEQVKDAIVEELKAKIEGAPD